MVSWMSTAWFREEEVQGRIILDKPLSDVELRHHSLLNTGPIEPPAMSLIGRGLRSSSLLTLDESSGVDTCCQEPSLPSCPCSALASL